MVWSRLAAEATNGEAAGRNGGRLGHFYFAAALAAVVLAAPLAGCSSPPEVARPGIASLALDTAKLAGLSKAELVARFGEPDFRRTEPPAELWQYRRAECVLDIFLYRDHGAFRVVHAETHDRGLIQVGSGCADSGGAFAPAPATRQSRL